MIRRVAFRLAAAALLIPVAACAPGSAPANQAAPSGPGPRLAFKERTHDFGTISASRTQEYRFALTNTGNEMLQIGDIRLEPAGPGG